MWTLWLNTIMWIKRFKLDHCQNWYNMFYSLGHIWHISLYKFFRAFKKIFPRYNKTHKGSLQKHKVLSSNIGLLRLPKRSFWVGLGLQSGNHKFFDSCNHSNVKIWLNYNYIKLSDSTLWDLSTPDNLFMILNNFQGLSLGYADKNLKYLEN